MAKVAKPQHRIGENVGVNDVPRPDIKPVSATSGHTYPEACFTSDDQTFDEFIDGGGDPADLLGGQRRSW